MYPRLRSVPAREGEKIALWSRFVSVGIKSVKLLAPVQEERRARTSWVTGAATTLHNPFSTMCLQRSLVLFLLWLGDRQSRASLLWWFPNFLFLHVFPPGLLIYFLFCISVDFKSRKMSPVEWSRGSGRGLGLTIPYPRAGLTLPRSVSGHISILTPPKSRALCPSHSVSHFFTKFIISDFFSCPNCVPSLQFQPSCLLQSTKNMENRLYSFPIQLFFMYLNIVNIPGSPEYMGFVSSTPECNTELFKAVNFPY